MTAFVTISVHFMETAVQMQTPIVIITVSTHCILILRDQVQGTYLSVNSAQN